MSIKNNTIILLILTLSLFVFGCSELETDQEILFNEDPSNNPSDIETIESSLWSSRKITSMRSGERRYLYFYTSNTGFGENHYLEWSTDWNVHQAGTFKICRKINGSYTDCTGWYNIMSRVYSDVLSGTGVQSYRIELKPTVSSNFYWRYED